MPQLRMPQVPPREPTSDEVRAREVIYAGGAARRQEARQQRAELATFLRRHGTGDRLTPAEEGRLAELVDELRISAFELAQHLSAARELQQHELELAAAVKRLAAHQALSKLHDQVRDVDARIIAAVAPLLAEKRGIIAAIEARKAAEGAVEGTRASALGVANHAPRLWSIDADETPYGIGIDGRAGDTE